MSDRKKAIETLKQLRLDYEEFYEEHNNEVTQAYDMAIASLETDEAYQLEYEQPEFCEDCISRAEAIKGVETWSGGWIEYIKSLPSVLPKSKTATENCIDCVYDEIEDENGIHCKKCLEGDNSQYKYVFDFVKENLVIKALEQEPRKGEWQLTDDEMFVYCPFCRQTDYTRPIDASWKYCPECGARLD